LACLESEEMSNTNLSLPLTQPSKLLIEMPKRLDADLSNSFRNESATSLRSPIHKPPLPPPGNTAATAISATTHSDTDISVSLVPETLVGSTITDSNIASSNDRISVVSEEHSSHDGRESSVPESKISSPTVRQDGSSELGSLENNTNKKECRAQSERESDIKSETVNVGSSVESKRHAFSVPSSDHPASPIDFLKAREMKNSPGQTRKSAIKQISETMHSNTPNGSDYSLLSIHHSTASVTSDSSRHRKHAQRKEATFESLGVYTSLPDSTVKIPFVNLVYPSTVEEFQEDVTSTKSRRMFKRRVETFEKSVIAMTTSSAALFRDRKRSLLGKTYEYVCSGAELAAYFLSSSSGDARLFSLAEATRYLDQMVQYGYLISVVSSQSLTI
jgi:hypothetical protein